MSAAEFLKCIEMGLVFGIVAIGIYLTFRTIDFPDLTCDGSFVLGAAVSAICITSGMNPYLALILSVIAGGCAGLLTGALHTVFKISNLLSGILVAFMLYSINLDVMMGNPNIVLLDKATIFSDRSPLLVLTCCAFVISGVIGYVLSTDFGLSLRSAGYNKRFVLNGGASVVFLTNAGLALSNGLIALGGGLFCQLEGFSDITLGPGTVIFGLAAVMIGEKIYPSRRAVGALLSCIAGSCVYRILMAFAMNSDWIGLRSKDLNLITGLFVILIMVVPMTRRNVFEK
jgi:putative ABC transport system permease protein